MHTRLILVSGAATLLLLAGLLLPSAGPSAAAPPLPTITPAPGPDDDAIVFIADHDGEWRGYGDGQWDIYILEGGDSEPQRLTFTDSAEDAPALSPDGSQIVFSSDAAGNRDIYVMDRDGGNLRALTDDSREDAYPVWSPDGAQIAFGSMRSGQWAVYVMDAGGMTPPQQVSPEALSWASFPVWSPDGARIAFLASVEGQSEIAVINADGSGFVNVSDHEAGDHGIAWSPDGQQIAFTSWRDDNAQLYVGHVDGSGVRRVTHTPAISIVSLAWSPDGAQLAFTGQDSERDYEWYLYTINADGTDQRVLVDAPGWELEPRFSADGARVYYWSDGASDYAHLDLYAVDAAGGTPERLTFFEGAMPMTGLQP